MTPIPKWMDEQETLVNYDGEGYLVSISAGEVALLSGDNEPVRAALQSFLNGGGIIEPMMSATVRLAEQRQAARVHVNELHEAVLCRLTENATQAERNTWAGKAAAVEAYINGTANTAQTALLNNEAQAMGETVQQQVDRIAAKSLAYHQVVGLVSGHRRKAIADLETANSIVEIEGIVAALNTVYDGL